MSHDPGALRARADALGPWFHNMDLGSGVWTAPGHFLGDYPGVKFRGFAHVLPEDLSGRSVLDIGCNGGFYSIEMRRRGASRVLGIDFDEDYLAQARFAAEVLGVDGIEFRRLSVYDVGALGERFDLVVFMGVFYHLRHPLLALDLVWEHAAADLLLFQSMQRGSDEVAAVAAAYPYTADPTNGWAPNRACSAAMLRSSGFALLANPDPEVFLCRRAARGPFVEAAYPARGPAR